MSNRPTSTSPDAEPQSEAQTSSPPSLDKAAGRRTAEGGFREAECGVAAQRGAGGKPTITHAGGGRSARHKAREFVVQGLYQWLVGGQDEATIQVQTEAVPGFAKADGEMFQSLLHETLLHAAELQDLVAPHVTRAWEDVSPIERGILLLAAGELRFHLETPYRVVINEAIELAKTFGGTDGHRFVNGVLDKLAPQLRPDEAKKG